jgi:branched-chain amino acid transport system substrate-binding protein
MYRIHHIFHAVSVTLLSSALALASAKALAADTIVIGRSLPLSGPLKAGGEAKRDGADAYIQKINAAGGVNGKQIKIVTLDDVYTPAKTVENIKKIVADDKPTAFMSLFGLPTVAAALPVLEALKMPAVGMSSGADGVRKPLNRYAFPVRASFADESRKIVSHIKITGVTKIGVVYQDIPYGVGVKNTFVAALKEVGLDAEVVALDAGAKNSAEAARLAGVNKPQAIFLAMLPIATVALLPELTKTSFSGSLYSLSPTDASVIAKQLGNKARGLAISQVVPIPYGTNPPVVSEYKQALKDLGRGTPSFFGLEAFIEAKILVEGLKRAGSDPTPASLVKSLETFRELDVGGFFISYTPTAHTGSTFVEVDVINASGVLMR